MALIVFFALFFGVGFSFRPLPVVDYAAQR